MEMINETATSPSQLNLNEWARQSLDSSAKWGKFLAIVGFVGCGLMLLIGVFAGTLFSSMDEFEGTNVTTKFSKVGGVAIGIMYAIIAILYFFPCLYLYRFSDKARQALRSHDENVLAESLNEQKKMFQFVGVLTIVLLSIYALIFLGAMFVGGMAA